MRRVQEMQVGFNVEAVEGETVGDNLPEQQKNRAYPDGARDVRSIPWLKTSQSLKIRSENLVVCLT